MKIQKQISIFIGFTMLFFIVFFSLINLNYEKVLKNQRLIRQSGRALIELDKVEANTAMIEADLRAFFISGKEDMLKDLARRRDSINVSISRIKIWNSLSPQQQKEIYKLEQLLSEKVNYNNSIIKKRKENKQTAEQKYIQTLNSQDLTTRVYSLINSVKVTESIRLEADFSKNIESIEKNFLLQFISSIVAFVVIALMVDALYRGNQSRKKTQLKLAESQRQMWAILNNAKDAVVLIRPDSTIVLFNEHAKEISKVHFGKALRENSLFLEYISEERRDYFRSLFNKVMQGQIEIDDVQLNTPTGPRWFETIFYPVIDEKGRVENICIATRDITERQNYQEELIVAKKNAENAEKLQQTFLANMSHEIRTPMNGIVGMTEILSGTELTREQREIVRTIKKSSETLLFLINDILDLSKIKAGKLNIVKESFELNEVLDSVASPFEIRAKSRNINFEVNGNIPYPFNVVGDRFRLIQILNNLLGNAFKFTKQGSVILSVEKKRISAEKAEVTFSVKDTGIGIEKENLDFIFKSFEQANGKVSREFGGTGLGLSISKKLIELQQGSINVDSTPGIGSTFSFTIPFEVSAPKIRPLATKKTLEDFTLLRGRKVLVAEDNETNQMVILKTLQNVGIECEIAKNGREAVDILSGGQNFDVIIMDLVMPELDGYETTRLLRNELNIQTPIIAMTASVLQDERSKCLDIGMNDYVSKPFNQIELFTSILRLLGEKTNPVSFKNNEDHKIFDLQYLNELGDVKYTREVLIEFLKNTPVSLETMEEAYDNRNPDHLFFTVHKLKSVLGLLKIKNMLNTSHVLESLTRDKSQLTENEWDRVKFLLIDLHKHYREVCPLVENEISKTESILNYSS